MLPVIVLVLVVLGVSPFVFHAVRQGQVSGWVPDWVRGLVDPQQPVGAVVAIQEELHRQIDRDQIVTLGRSKIAPAGAAVRCHPDDAAKARAILPQVKTEAVSHARTGGLAISESFEVRIDDDPACQPRRPKVVCWIAGQNPPEPPTTPEVLSATVPVVPGASEATGPAGDTWREITGTPPQTGDVAPASHDLATQVLAQGDIPTDHQPLSGMLQLTDRQGRVLRIKAGAAGQVIGRSEHADIRINHRAISREHALLLREGDGYTIEAYESCVNGVWVDSHPATAGDPIRLIEGSTVVFAPEVIYTVSYKAAA